MANPLRRGYDLPVPSDRDYPRIFAVNGSRLYALLWAAVFLVLINIGIACMFGKETLPERFHYHAFYEEVTDAIDAVRAETRPTAVFVGGSVLWGAGSKDAGKSVPAEFARLVGSGVAVYNLAMVAGRPIDSYLISYLLKDSADLIVADYNYEFGLPLTHDRLVSDRGTYVRMGQLYDTFGPEMFHEIPAMKACLTDRGLPVPGHDNRAEAGVRSFYERNIPVFQYKDRVNDALFGQHPLSMVEFVPLRFAQRIRASESFSLAFVAGLFKSPEGLIKEEPWKPGVSPVKENLVTTVFNANDLQSCLGRAWSAYAIDSARQFTTYLLPNNPVMYPTMHASEIHAQNVMHLRTVFNNVPFYNFDDGTMSGDSFTDSTHLTASGSAAFARRLFDVLQADGRIPSAD